MRKPFILRQGDVLICRIAKASIPRGVEPIGRDRGRIVLAYGEVTGHAHAIGAPEAELLHDAETEARFLHVLAEGGVDLVHEQHGTITIPKGTYEVVQQREYTPEQIRSVAD